MKTYPLLNKAPRHEDVWVNGGIALRFINFGATGSRFSPSERASVTHWIGGWVGPRAGHDAVTLTETVDKYDTEPAQFSLRHHCLFPKSHFNNILIHFNNLLSLASGLHHLYVCMYVCMYTCVCVFKLRICV